MVAAQRSRYAARSRREIYLCNAGVRRSRAPLPFPRQNRRMEECYRAGGDKSALLAPVVPQRLCAKLTEGPQEFVFEDCARRPTSTTGRVIERTRLGGLWRLMADLMAPLLWPGHPRLTHFTAARLFPAHTTPNCSLRQSRREPQSGPKPLRLHAQKDFTNATARIQIARRSAAFCVDRIAGLWWASHFTEGTWDAQIIPTPQGPITRTLLIGLSDDQSVCNIFSPNRRRRAKRFTRNDDESHRRFTPLNFDL